jgi:hypothetical protein
MITTVFTHKHLHAVLVDVASHRRVVLEFCATNATFVAHDSIMGEQVLLPISAVLQLDILRAAVRPIVGILKSIALKKSVSTSQKKFEIFKNRVFTFALIMIGD